MRESKGLTMSESNYEPHTDNQNTGMRSFFEEILKSVKFSVSTGIQKEEKLLKIAKKTDRSRNCYCAG